MNEAALSERAQRNLDALKAYKSRKQELYDSWLKLDDQLDTRESDIETERQALRKAHAASLSELRREYKEATGIDIDADDHPFD